MVTVTAPDGVAVDSESRKPLAGSGDNADTESSEFDFADIDQVLAQKQSQPAQPAKKPARRAPPSQPDGDDETHLAEPILPNQQWTASSTRQTQKRILLGAAIAGLMLLATVVVFAIRANRANLHSQPSSDEPAAAVLGDEADKEDKAAAEPFDKESNSNPADSVDEREPEADLESNSKSPVAGTDPVRSTDTDSTDSDSGDITDTSELVPAPSPDSAQVQVPEAPVATPPAASGFEDLLDATPADPPPLQSNFEELAGVLENSGDSLFDFTQIATLTRNRRVGLPRYFIPRPEPLDPRNMKRLSDPVAGAQYSGVSLLAMVNEFALITGVPISFDAVRLDAAGFDFGQRFGQFKITDTTFQAIIEKALQRQNQSDQQNPFVLVYDGESPATISANDASNEEPRSIELPQRFREDADATNSAIELVRALIAPGTWNTEPNNYSIAASANGFEVRHDKEVVRRIERLMGQWELAAKIKSGEATVDELQTLWQRSAQSRQAKFDFRDRYETPITLFLCRLQSATDVNVIVDWNELAQQGWNPTAMIPPGIDEENIEDLLDEITHSMDAAWRIINENTFEITSIEIVNQSRLLEFYNCGAILAGPLDQQKMLELFRQSLQADAEGYRNSNIYFDAETEFLIAVAPQHVHRQITAIIARLQQLQ